MANPYFPTALPTRQGFRLYDPANPTNTYTTPLNPLQVKRTPGTLRKWTPLVNGNAAIIGNTETAPKMIQLIWPQLDKASFDAIRTMCAVAPIVMVDNNDQGYLGVLVCDSPEQLANVSLNVWNATFSFLVIAPYNGTSTTINTLAIPTVTPTVSTTGGFINGSTTLYLFATVVTKWGESAPGPAISVTTPNGTNTNMATLAFTAPTSGYYKKLRLYWNTANNSATATWLTDIWAGMTSTYTLYTGYIPYSTLVPPTYGRNFTGDFQGSLWTNGT